MGYEKNESSMILKDVIRGVEGAAWRASGAYAEGRVGAPRVEGLGRVGGGFEAKACGLQVFQEGLGTLVEEVVRWLIKPPAAVPVPVGLEAKGVAPGAFVKEVVEGVIGPAAPAGEVIVGDVRPEPAGVVRCERVADREAKGSGGSVAGVHGEGLARLWVRIRSHSLLPKGVVVATMHYYAYALVTSEASAVPKARIPPCA